MRKISKLGASALALALSLTMVAPVSAQAAYYDTDVNGVVKTYDAEKNTWTTTDESNATVTYKNKVTGKTYTAQKGKVDTNSTEYKAATEDYEIDFLTKVTVGTDEFYNYGVNLEYGETLKSFKIKKGAGNITLKQVGKSESVSYPNYDSQAKQYYFYNKKREKAYVGTPCESSDATREALKSTKYGYTYRLFGKKVGKSVIELKYKNAAGKTVTKKITVTVTNDARVFTSVSYAGKSLIHSYDKAGNNSNLLYAQTSNKEGIDYTTKKSGKFKVKMGKNYKYIATYVLTPTEYVPVTSSSYHSEGGYGDYSYSYDSKSTNVQKRNAGGIDLNGDGDTNDTINGVDENDFSHYTAKKIGNGKKITLSKVPNSKSDYNYYWTHTENGKSTTTSSTSKYTSNMATTTVLVLYQDKVTKNYSYATFSLTLKVGK